MDDIVTDVNEGWDEEDPTHTMQYVFFFFSLCGYVGRYLIGRQQV